MDFMTLAADRYSVRKFSDKAVEEEKLNKVLEAGRIAPSAKNIQPQRIYVLKSPEAVEKIRAITRNAFDAPVLLLVCGDMKEGWVNPFNDHNSAEMDASICAAQMMLQMTELGLGSTWACYIDFAKVKEAFHLPDHIEPFLLLPMGYPAEDSKPAPQHTSRKPLEETVSYL